MPNEPAHTGPLHPQPPELASIPNYLEVIHEARILPPLDRPDVYPRRFIEERSEPYYAAIAPEIAELALEDFNLSMRTLADADEASAAIARFDADMQAFPAPFAAVLLRSESASSSQIEHLTAGARAIAEAEIDERVSGNAPQIVRNVRAMQAAIALAGEISNETIIEMQRVLLEGRDSRIVGRYRDQQVWIGSGDLPHHAKFVPPHHERVAAAMDDVVAFARRGDLPSLAHAAITHAQFETVHPFGDGNGRTGRALVQSMLRRSGLMRHVTVPISSGLLSNIDGYFEALGAYREGDPDPIVTEFARAAFAGISNARQLNSDLQETRASWAQRLSRLRRDAGAHRLADVLLEQPAINARVVAERLGVGPQSAQNAIDPLVTVGILRPANSRARRGRIWLADEVIGALDEFALRSGRRHT